MKTNTSEYIPYKSVAPNIISKSDWEWASAEMESIDHPFFEGTGFFVQLKNNVFYLTAKHCLFDQYQNDFRKDLYIFHEYNGNTIERIYFSEWLSSCYEDSADEMIDIAIGVVDKSISQNKMAQLIDRSLNLYDQKLIDHLLNELCISNQKIRLVGFPQNHKKIHSESNSQYRCECTARGYYGRICNNSKSKNFYGIEDASWEEAYEGFSGSPIIGLYPTKNQSTVKVIVLGMLLTSSRFRGEFISINIITNTIEAYLLENIQT